MAVDMFLKIQGIDGEAQDSAHKGSMDVLSWSWGMSQSGPTHSGGGGGAGKVNVQDISITKWVDKASPNLMMACSNGKHFPKALLTVRKAGENPVEYIKITMENLIVSSISTGGSGGEDKLTENITINFAKVKTEYTPQKADGSAEAAIEYGWNIAENKKL
jgi:type VI secretion system secreted protein Hcp